MKTGISFRPTKHGLYRARRRTVLYGNNLAHAEINAIVQLKRKEHPNIRAYTLYTTTEPCILCFGAIVMGNVRHCKYAARDRYAGAARYTEHSDYVKSKNIQIEGPHDILKPYKSPCIPISNWIKALTATSIYFPK